jgi:site-specific DNA recombinase
MSAQASQKGKCISGRAPVQPRPSGMQSAVSILRVSTKKQLSEGEGIENQRRGNTEYIRRKRYRLHREFVLAETADDKERTDFDAVLDYVIAHKKEIDVVVFWKVDRISRAGVGTYYALKSLLARHDVRIEFATEQIDGSPAGELMESVLAATARFENRLRVDRTIGVEKILTREGYWCRSAPTGFVNGRDKQGKPILLPHPDRKQWELLCGGLRRQLTGVYKISDVVAELQANGFVTHKGNPLSRQGWTKICRNPLYGGLICERWTDYQYVRAKFDGPLSSDAWYQLQRVLDGRQTVALTLPRQHMNPDFPLRRFLRCPKCNAPVRGYPVAKKNGRRYRYYDCESAACRFRVSVEQAHTLFVKLLQEMAPTPEALQLFRELVLREWELRWDERRATTDGVQARVASLRKERESLLTLMKSSADSPSLIAEFQKDFARVEKDLTLATMERNDAEVQEYDAEAVVGACTYFLAHASELWEKWPAEAKSRLQAMVFPDGVSYADLEGKQTAKRSVIYDALADSPNPATVAAPRCRVTNSVIQALIAWYKELSAFPPATNARLLL